MTPSYGRSFHKITIFSPKKKRVSSLDILFRSFENYIPLNKEEKADLGEMVTERRIKRKQFILQEEEICRHFSFVVEGCFKKFQVDKHGVEHNLQFIAENDWVIEIDSFYHARPSHVFVEAIEPAVILQLNREDLITLYGKYPKFNRIFRVIIENRFVELENRVLQTISSTAEERYLFFIRHYPSLTSRLPNTQIASYLGITPEFLSKIRKDLSQRK